MSKIYKFFYTNKLFKMVEIKLSIFQYPLVKAAKLYLFQMKNKLFRQFKRTQDILFHMQENVFKRQATNVLNFTYIIFTAQKSVLKAKGSCTTKSLKTQKMSDKFYIFLSHIKLSLFESQFLYSPTYIVEGSIRAIVIWFLDGYT